MWLMSDLHAVSNIYRTRRAGPTACLSHGALRQSNTHHFRGKHLEIVWLISQRQRESKALKALHSPRAGVDIDYGIGFEPWQS